jgi:hypothetical protein
VLTAKSRMMMERAEESADSEEQNKMKMASTKRQKCCARFHARDKKKHGMSRSEHKQQVSEVRTDLTRSLAANLSIHRPSRHTLHTSGVSLANELMMLPARAS